jgi:hypothetical protein
VTSTWSTRSACTHRRPPRSDRLSAPPSRAGAGRQLGRRDATRDRRAPTAVRRLSHEEEAYTLASDCASTAPRLGASPRPAPTAVSDGGYEGHARRRPGSPRPSSEPAVHDLEKRPDREGGAVPRRRRTPGRAARRGPGVSAHPPGGGQRRLRLGRLRSDLPTEGRYRLILQFKPDGRVRTVAFTRVLRSS